MNPEIRTSAVAVLFLFLGAGWRALAGGEPGGGLKANLDLPFDAAGESDGDEEDAPEIVIFWGQRYEGDGIFFCCDKSDSMSGAPMERLRKEMIESLRQLSERAQIGIVLFDSRVYQFPATGRPATATAQMKAAGESWIRSVSPGSCSCYKEGLLTALNFALQSTVRRKLIIVLGDGHVFCPGVDRNTYARETLRAVAERNCQAIQINTICLGSPGRVNEEWMRELAEQNGGRYTRIYTSN